MSFINIEHLYKSLPINYIILHGSENDARDLVLVEDESPGEDAVDPGNEVYNTPVFRTHNNNEVLPTIKIIFYK